MLKVNNCKECVHNYCSKFCKECKKQVLKEVGFYKDLRGYITDKNDTVKIHISQWSKDEKNEPLHDLYISSDLSEEDIHEDEFIFGVISYLSDFYYGYDVGLYEKYSERRTFYELNPIDISDFKNKAKNKNIIVSYNDDNYLTCYLVNEIDKFIKGYSYFSNEKFLSVIDQDNIGFKNMDDISHIYLFSKEDIYCYSYKYKNFCLH